MARMLGAEKAKSEPYPIACSLSLTSAIFSLRSQPDKRQSNLPFITVRFSQRLRNDAEGLCLFDYDRIR